jgi:hypothetical protein
MAVVAVACAVMSGCGDAPDRGHRTSSPNAVQFHAEGRAVESSKAGRDPSLELIPDIPGISRLGSITLQLSSSRTSSQKCSLTPPGVVSMSYTATTSFEPPDMTRYGTLPESLHGRVLNIRGKLFEVGQRCLPVAMTVKDVGGAPPEALASTGVSTKNESSEDKEAPSALKGETTALNIQKQREASRREASQPEAPRPVPLPPTPEASPLPLLAPEVRSSFRPSLPDPPTG